MSTVFVVNPASANGRTGKVWPELSAKVSAAGVEHKSVFTSRAGEATDLAASALAGGASTVVAVGGDGTLNEVANGFLRDGKSFESAALALLPQGTGGDFKRTLGIPPDVDGAIEAIARRHLRRIDAGRIEMAGLDGEPLVRWFINIADAGIGGVVVERVNRTTKLFGGKSSFMYASIATLLSYKPQSVVVESAEGQYEGPAQNVVVANCQYFGGSMHVAPKAQPDDGLFDVIVFGDIGGVEAIRSIGAIYKAEHVKNPKVKGWRTAELRVSSQERVLIDVDGEMCGTLPATFTIVPQAINVVVP